MAVVPTVNAPYLVESRKRSRTEPIELIEVKREKTDMEGEINEFFIVLFFGSIVAAVVSLLVVSF